ncbi:ribonuclease P protein component [Legionella israelensis]|uniref:Ribonuclease P protein component n=1 Tax=Legionella israelensis TaxID=454 RepID=A0AAX1ED25_9GAMM|nr:ribonuclease P protein component [Legionella israelensis]QBR83000.1 ribonuclease P protein component [Legionella israelensis]QDP71481.1 ribonuclease P protein component [Legionella israelensis]
MYEFKKSDRLLKKSQYDHVFANAKKIVTSNFIVLYRENTIGHARLGLALSKKAVPKAHDRNRIKRLLREAFRKTDLPAVDMIFLAKPRVSKVSNSEVLSNLGKIWPQLIQC